ncbi:MAG: HAD family hydrolase [Desulfuromonadales bacterium]|nr:HAD family hydrolase [Desulfuromonadales bacterium]MBN2791272.1 HAD family hydrolase [Desulfuromonadales bacterium]
MERIEAIIFDCDGVMFESREANLAYYNRILEQFAYPRVSAADGERAHLCHTASSPEVLKGLMRLEDVAPALEFAARLDYHEFIPQMIPERFLEQVLADLQQRYPLAIATNRGQSIRPILEHFNLADYFSVIVTSHDVARPKPAPDMLLLAAEKLGVSPRSCLFIGDSELDRRAAFEASVQFSGYGDMVTSERTVVTHLDLLEWLAEY